jgi:hypothetical protein
MGGTVYHRRFKKCEVCGGSGDIVVDMSCGDCDPCIGGRPDQCALLSSPNDKLSHRPVGGAAQAKEQHD